MARYEKWLLTATAKTLSDEVARSALAERLLAVSYYLKKAISDGDEAEAIHQLRVWTRRSATALDLFAPGLPVSRRAKMLKTLHKLRQAAGAVRDCDVQRNRLKQTTARIPRRAKRDLDDDRRQARRGLKKLRRRLRHKDRFRLEVEKLLESVAWPKRSSRRTAPAYGTLCRQQLTQLSRVFFRQAKSNLRDFARLHELRITGKSWRYTLELAVSVVPALPLERLYQALDDFQDRFGLICDQRAFLESLQKWLDQAQSSKQQRKLEALRKAEQRRHDLAYQKLLRWWSPARLRQFRQLAKAAS